MDRVPERLARAAGPRHPTRSTSSEHGDDLGDVIRDMTDGRGTDSVIDAVGMEAHGSPVAKIAQQITGLLPDALAKPMMQKAGVDRLDALYSAIDIVRRGGTISLIGVYGGMADPLPMLTLFDKQIQLRMGQANVKKWVDDIMPLLTDDDPLGVDTFATHTLPLGRGAARLRHLPEEAGRRRQGHPPALTGGRYVCAPVGLRTCRAVRTTGFNAPRWEVGTRRGLSATTLMTRACPKPSVDWPWLTIQPTRKRRPPQRQR